MPYATDIIRHNSVREVNDACGMKHVFRRDRLRAKEESTLLISPSPSCGWMARLAELPTQNQADLGNLIAPDIGTDWIFLLSFTCIAHIWNY